jgi:hypothetical protein
MHVHGPRFVCNFLCVVISAVAVIYCHLNFTGFKGLCVCVCVCARARAPR